MASDYDTLSEFGPEFQTKVLASLLTDRPFMDQTHEIIRADFFESDANQWIVQNILEYYHEYSIPPSKAVFKIKLRTELKDDDVFREVVTDQLKNVFRHTGDLDLPWIRDQFSEFCKNQRMKSALLRSIDLMHVKDWEGISKEIDEAQKAGVAFDIGHDYFEDVAKRLDEDARDTVKTPWEVINSLMDGGLGPGELGVWMAPTGGGKSWGLANLAMEGVRRGKNVVHITLELADKYTGRRYDSVVTKIPSQQLLSNQERIHRTLENMEGHGKLLIKYYPPKSITVRTLKTYIERLRAYGIHPDMMIVDYADKLKHTTKSSDNRYDEMGGVYEELRGLAGELQIPVWTATQTNRDGVEKNVISTEDIADSFAKAMEADFIMSLSRTTNDKVNDRGRFHIAKNRFGPDGMTFPAKVDLSSGQIEIYDANSSSGHKLKRSMDGSEDEDERKLLLKRYREIKQNRESATEGADED